MTDQYQPLPRTFYQRDATLVARELLGCCLVHVVDGVPRVGRIVEVEAYLGPKDLAAHSSKGLTQRTRVLFGPPGHAYVYFVYGMHWCMNVVTGKQGEGTAVLLRALEPVLNLSERTTGPALLCKAMGIDKRFNGHDLVSDDLFVAAGSGAGADPGGDAGADAGANGNAGADASAPATRPEIVACPRIGVAYAGAWAALPLRFYLKGNRFVSRR